MNLSIKNRIALYSVIGIASLSLVVFVSIYFSVKQQSLSQIDKKLKLEADIHLKEIQIEKDSIYFKYKNEWFEREHVQLQVYPLFVELVNKKGQYLDKSPNLLDKHLHFDLTQNDMFIKNDVLSNNYIRQIQLPVFEQDKIKGYLAIAISYGDTRVVLESLLKMLLIIFPLLLIITFFTSKLISNITIRPITQIANRVSEIHTGNLDKRVPDQKNGDELQVLSEAINDFLDRIDEGIKREKQFTADASHQLRTPLSVMKGNLEILLRQDRTQTEYKDEIKKAISKIDEMTDAVEKLLILARLNKSNQKLKSESVNLYNLLENTLSNYKTQIISKNLLIKINEDLNSKNIVSKKMFLELIFDNLISNAIKYAYPETAIEVDLKYAQNGFYVCVINQGPEINSQNIDDIFMPFYRHKDHENTEKGYGLGLAIVKKASEALNLKIFVKSENHTTSFSVFYKT